MSLALTLHTLAAVIWVGGMFMLYVVVRPAANQELAPEQRLPLWSRIFTGFFPWVWLSIVVLLLSGFALLMHMGGMAAVGKHVHIMLLLGVVMMLIFFHVFFSPFKRLKRTVKVNDWLNASLELVKIRRFMLVNLLLGLLVVAIGSGGRYWGW